MKPLRYARCKYRKFETIVTQGASMSPSECLIATEQGIPIGSQFVSNDLLTYDDVNDMEVPLERQRGQDIDSLWQAHEEVAAKYKETEGYIKRKYKAQKGDK